MKQNYSEFRITKGMKEFHDFFVDCARHKISLPSRWIYRTDEYLDIKYVVFTGEYDGHEFDVHFVFKNEFSEGYIGNICPRGGDPTLTTDEYNQRMDMFVDEIITWYVDQQADKRFDYQYDKVPTGQFSVSKIPSEPLVLSIKGEVAGVSVAMDAILKTTIKVTGRLEYYDTKDPNVFKYSKLYEAAEFTFDISKMDCFKAAGSDKTPLELLKNPNSIEGFTFNGSSYISDRNLGLCSANILGDRLVLYLC